MKKVRYSDDRKSVKKNSAKEGAKKTEEEIVLIENWNNLQERERRICKEQRRLLKNFSEFVKRKERLKKKNN